MSIALPKTSGMVTIRYVVMSVLNRLGQYDLKSYKRLVQICIEGYTDLAIWHIGQSLETVYLHMSTAKTVDLPSDFISYVKIGVPINGKLRVLTHHNQILLPRTFYNTLIQAAAQFVTDNEAAYLIGGVVLSSSGAAIIFTSGTAGVNFTGSTTIVNTSGDMSGTVVNTTANAPAVKRVDTITLSGTYGTASILCDALTKTVAFDSGEAVGNTDSDDGGGISNAIYFSDHFRNGVFIGGMYGLPGGIDEAYCRVDRENRQIVFSGSVPRSEIVLEYISSGVKEGGGTLIPREAVPALRTYVLWQMVENDPKVAYNERERRKREHEEAVEMLRSFQQIFTKDEYLRMVYGTSKQSPKR